MRKFRIKNMPQMPNRDKILTKCVDTVNGLECAHINMDTGEISYSAEACIDEKLMREAFSKEGMDIEDEQ